MSTAVAVVPGKSSSGLAALAPLAERIRGHIRQTTAGIIAIGRDLLHARSIIDHGQFLDWIDREIGITARTAQNYMRAAEWSEDKCEAVSLLPPSTVYALAAPSAPPEIKAEVIAKLEAGETVDGRVVEERIRQERALARRKNRTKPVPVETQRRKDREHRAWLAEQVAAERAANLAATEIADLISCLPEDNVRRIRTLLDVPMVGHALVGQFGRRATP